MVLTLFLPLDPYPSVDGVRGSVRSEHAAGRSSRVRENLHGQRLHGHARYESGHRENREDGRKVPCEGKYMVLEMWPKGIENRNLLLFIVHLF